MEEKKIPLSAKDIVEWKNKTENKNWPESVEAFNKSYAEKCGGKGRLDVLFSFLGIYSVGVWVYNKDNEGLFKCEKNKIRVSVEKDGKYNQILCSKTFLLQLQKEKIAGIDVTCLNDCIEKFSKLYFEVGNLIPMWPGGNMLKGNQNMGFMDIPELFFIRYYDWYQILAKREDAYLQEMTEYLDANKIYFGSLETFLGFVDSVDKYKIYIDHVVDVISKRSQYIIGM